MSAASLDEVMALLVDWGVHRYDEDVTQLAHALQTAARAEAAGAPPTLVTAALLHDVGHLLDLRRGEPEMEVPHELLGSAWLRPLFPAAVTAPIALHVRAKRYLCAVDEGYERALSAGSTRSLASQGGLLTPAEVAAFERVPGHAEAVQLRRWDDEAKVVGASVPPLETYRHILVAVGAGGGTRTHTPEGTGT